MGLTGNAVADLEVVDALAQGNDLTGPLVPMMKGSTAASLSRRSAWIILGSEPQMATLLMRHSTSPGPGFGTGTVASCSLS